jgi:hypothetical protein
LPRIATTSPHSKPNGGANHLPTQQDAAGVRTRLRSPRPEKESRERVKDDDAYVDLEQQMMAALARD